MVQQAVRPAQLQVKRWAAEPLVKLLVPQWVPAPEARWGERSANDEQGEIRRGCIDQLRIVFDLDQVVKKDKAASSAFPIISKTDSI